MSELKILLLEDTPSDAELLEYSLRREGMAFTALRVDTEPAFKQALSDFKPDIVLADYNLPSYNGRTALDYVQRVHPDIPVVMVSGAIGEEMAVELLTAGARDYILKDRMARLPAAVQRVLGEKKEEQRRREAEEKFRRISESAQDAIIMLGVDRRISFWNAAAERVFGYTAAEAMGQELHPLLTPPAAQAAFARGFQHFSESGEGPIVGKVIEVTALRKGGEEFPVELSVSATQLNGQWHAIGIVRDITERRRAEKLLRENEQNYRTLSDSAPALIWASGTDKLCNYFNQPWLKFTGRALEQELGNGWAEGVHPDDFQHCLDVYMSAFGRCEPFSMEYRLRRYDGEFRWMRDDGCPRYDSDGNFLGYIGYLMDVTERKLAEQALLRHVRDLNERVKEINCLHDITNLLLNKEGGMERMLDACAQRIPAAWLDPSHTCARIRMGGQTFESANFRETECKLTAVIPMSRTEPGVIEVFYSGEVAGGEKSPFIDEEHALIQSIAIQISQSLENRLAEKALRESEKLYRSLFENTLNGIAHCRVIFQDGIPADVEYIAVNAGFEKTTGLKGVEGRRISEIIPGYCRDNPDSLEAFGRVARTGEPARWEHYLAALDRWFLFSVYSPVQGEIVIVSDNITERKRAEAALNHANRALAALSAVNRSLVRAASEEELLLSICRSIVEQRGYRMAWVGYKQHDEGKTVKVMASAGHDEGYLDAAQITWAETEYGMGPTGRALRSGTTQLCQDFANDPHNLPWRDAALKRGYAASIALPLANDKVFGVLTVYAEELNSFTSGEVSLLEEMANDLAFGVRTLHTRQERDTALKQSQQHLMQLRESLEDTVQAIATIVEMRDPYTAGHQVRVAELAAAIARQMGLPDDQVHGIRLAGIVHDLGKIQVPAEILSKPGRISDIEHSFIKVHAQAGYDILKDIEFPWPIAQMVLQHHERLDGSGYPQGLKGDAILLETRILSVADVVEAMSSHRPYRAGLGIDAALEEIARQRGIHFDPQVVDACLALFREQGYSLEQAHMNPHLH